MKTTPHTDDTLNQMNKRECFGELQGFRCQYLPKRYSEQVNWSQKGSHNEARNLQRHPCGTGSQKVFKKAVRRRKPVVQKNLTKLLLWIWAPSNSQNATGETNTITTLHQMRGGSTNQVPLLAFLNSDLNAIRTISRACRENAEDYVLKLRRWENTGNWNEDDD